MADRNTVTLSIMGRDYRLSVTPEEEENLRVCAQIVEAKMKEIHQPGRVYSPDAVAVLAALRIAYDYLNQRQAIEKVQQAQSQIESIITMCENAVKR